MGPCLDENLLLRFVEGLLSPDERRPVESHVDACPACRGTLAELARTASLVEVGAPPLETSPSAESEVMANGTRLGRYVVLQRVSSGAMGIVYRAYDPELDRKVAIKLLRTDRPGLAEHERALMQGEAKAMARLAHPHVVPIHDVGRLGDRVFLAMAWVDGVTLADWLAAARPWRAQLQPFLQAADALAAAHAAGIVHRDFKPENVLVSSDGRALVTDFGLSVMRDRVSPLGAFKAGTPAYMAPEQLASGKADAKSDQFSFCVSLYEGLFGVRPFAGDSLEALAAAIAAQKPARPTRGHRVPAGVRRLVLRGLALRPQERFESMAALAAALERAARPLPRAAVALGALVVLAAALAAGAGLKAAQRSRTCAAVSAQGAWDPARRKQIHQAFVRTGVPFAELAFARTADVLDTWVAGWSNERRRACDAAGSVGAVDPAWLERQRCFDWGLLQLRGLADVLAEPDPSVVESATAAALRLPPPGACTADAPELRAEVPVAQAATLARARALYDAGRYGAGIPVAKEAIAAAGAIAASSTLAQALLQLGALQDKAGEFADSEASLERAIDTALANRDGRVAAAAWVRLVAVVGSGRGDAPRAHHLAARAQAAIAGIGGDDRLRATLATELAGVLTDEGRYPEALVEDLRALELSRAATGPESPDTLRALSNVAATLTMLERFDEALPKAREVLALTEKVFGPEHPQVAYCLNGLAAALAGRGEHEEAVKVYRRAIGLREKALGPDNPALVPLLGNLCQLLGGQLARFDEAVPMCERSIGIVERAKGADHVDAAIGHYMLGQVLRAQGQLPRAVEELERARATFEARFGADNPNLSDVLFELGQAHASLLHRPVAVKLLEQAVVLADKGSHASSRGDARWALARVLAPSDPQRARALAEAAKHDLASAAGKEAQQAEIEAFLGSMR